MSNEQQAVGFARRLGAMFYDSLLLGATTLLLGSIVSIIVSRMMGWDSLPPGSLAARMIFILQVGMLFVMFGWFWTHGGQTLGMRAWKIRVVTYDGHQLDWQQAFFRFVSGMFSLMAFGAGFLIAIFDSEKLGWHDRFSRTRLVRV